MTHSAHTVFRCTCASRDAPSFAVVAMAKLCCRPSAVLVGRCGASRPCQKRFYGDLVQVLREDIFVISSKLDSEFPPSAEGESATKIDSPRLHFILELMIMDLLLCCWMLVVVSCLVVSKIPVSAFLSSSRTSFRSISSLKMSSVASEARAKQLFRQTPLIRSDPLSRLAGTPVYLKLDALQNSGSFKDRGMAHLCLELSKQGVTKIISSSGGNAGLAAATVAQQLQLDCQVVVPITTKQLVVEKLESLGATVQVIGENWNAADAVVQKMVADDASGKTAYIPPYENPLLWTGHSTVIDEIYEEMGKEKPATVIVSVGGGGLLCGVLEGLDRLNVKCNVIAAETDGASSFAQAWNSGELVTLPSIDSVATSLGALQVSETAIERSKSHESKSLGSVTTAICTDAEAVDACLQFARDHRMLVEPACGAALAVLYSKRLRKGVEGPIVVQVCGGSGVNLELLQQWKEQLSL